MSKFSNEEITRATKDVLEPKNFPKERYDLVKYCVESVLADLMNLSTVCTLNCYDSDIKEEEIQHYVGLATKRISRYRKETPVKKSAKSVEAQCVLNLGKQVLDVNKLPSAGANITIRRVQPPMVSRSAASSRSRSHIAVQDMKSTNSPQQPMNKTLRRDAEVKNKANPLNDTLSSFKLPEDASKKGRLRLMIPKPAYQSLKPKKEALDDADVKFAEKSIKKKKHSNVVNANSDDQTLKPEKVLEVGGAKLPDTVVMPEIVQSADQSLKPKKVELSRKQKPGGKSSKKNKPLDVADKIATSVEDQCAPDLGKQVLDANITIRRAQSPILSRSPASQLSGSQIAVQNSTTRDSPQQFMSMTLDRIVQVEKKADPLNHTLSSFKLPDEAAKKGRLRLTIRKPADKSLKPTKEVQGGANVKTAEKSDKKTESNVVKTNSDDQVLTTEKVLDIEGVELADVVLTPENIQSAYQSLKPNTAEVVRKIKTVEKSMKKKKPPHAAIPEFSDQKARHGISNESLADKKLYDITEKNMEILNATAEKPRARSMKPKKVVDAAKEKPAVKILKRKNKSIVAESENQASCALEEPTKRRKLDETDPKKVLQESLSEKPLGALQGDSVRSRFIDDGNLSFEELRAAIERKIAGKIEAHKKATMADLLARKRDFEKRLESACDDGNLSDKATFERFYNMLFLKIKS